MLNVEIDTGSGFCGGVIRAVTRAEEVLARGVRLYSLGAIVHNEEELSRLSKKGLVTIQQVADIPEGETVLIRAHGEPPSTYEAAAGRKLEVIDCSCPVVLQLQRNIREAYARLHADGQHGKCSFSAGWVMRKCWACWARWGETPWCWKTPPC